MGAYLKITHQKKKWWMPRLKMCIEGCNDPKVVEFAEKLLLNLLGMDDEDYYTVLYIGESICFRIRMNFKDPVRFLSWFPATHVFMVAQLRTDQHNKNTLKAACLGLEACLAILMSFRLPGLKYNTGRCFNNGDCGCRFWGNGDDCFSSSWTYKTFEKVGEEFLPLMVHQNFKDLERVFGIERGENSGVKIQTSQSFTQFSNNSKVYVKAFCPYANSDEIEHLFQLANERGGDERSYELRKEVYMMNATPGVIVSKTGKFEEDGGILGVDFMGFTSLKKAIVEKNLEGQL